MMPQRPKVLIIDDTPANLQTLGRALASDYELFIATSGVEGLRLAEEVQPDIILLDIMMPQMDGYEAAQLIWGAPATAHITALRVQMLSL